MVQYEKGITGCSKCNQSMSEAEYKARKGVCWDCRTKEVPVFTRNRKMVQTDRQNFDEMEACNICTNLGKLIALNTKDLTVSQVSGRGEALMESILDFADVMANANTYGKEHFERHLRIGFDEEMEK